jgi:predicted nucleotidyltransferase
MSSATPAVRFNLRLPQDRIAALCEKYQVEELSLFGSVLRDDFGPESDVDFLVVFKNGDAGPWMGKVFALEEDLAALLGRKAEVALKDGVERSENRMTRSSILGSAQVIYRASGAGSVPDGPGLGGSQQAPCGGSAVPPLVLARIRYEAELIAEFCRRNHIARLALFGSVLRDDFRPESDVDVLVEFEPGRTPGLRFFTIQDDLSQSFRRRVDLNTREDLSVYFRDQVLAEAVPLYVES